jgi:4-deoxy-L-threo-5-hexosulose-uronate ketol-isomerase
MLTVETRHAIYQDHAKGIHTAALRKHFLAKDLFADSEIRLIYTHYDRFVMGAAVPAGKSLTLDKVDETRTASFLEQREMGIVNIGDTGSVVNIASQLSFQGDIRVASHTASKHGVARLTKTLANE